MARRSSRLKARASSVIQDETNDAQNVQYKALQAIDEDEGNAMNDRPATDSKNVVHRVPLQGSSTLAWTPRHTTPSKPERKEMHPSHFHSTTAKPLDEERTLGFTAMIPQTESVKSNQPWVAAAQATPTKTLVSGQKLHHNKGTALPVSPPQISFTFRRENSMELSPAAKQIMLEKREEAVRIRAQMTTPNEDAPLAQLGLTERKIATPKSVRGRYSDAHSKEFGKMDSIANHPSAFRVKTPGAKASMPVPTTSTALKRKASKADLDNESNPRPADTGKALPRLPSSEVMLSPSVGRRKRDVPTPTSTSSPADGGRSGTKRRKSQHVQTGTPRTPPASLRPERSLRLVQEQPPSPSPVKVAPPLPPSAMKGANASSPSKSALKVHFGPGTLSQLPTLKHSINKIPIQHVTQDDTTPLLLKSPSKPPSAMPADGLPKSPSMPLLCRSPSKKAPAATVNKTTGQAEPERPTTPLLSRSPTKNPSKPPSVEDEHNEAKTPLLIRSPVKITLESKLASPTRAAAMAVPQTPTGGHRTPSASLRARFSALRGASGSAMKSILRTPQRLYSDDPFKVAAGTHLGTPTGTPTKKTPGASTIKKRVDFNDSLQFFGDSGSAATESSMWQPPHKRSVQQAVKDAVENGVAAYPSLPAPDLAAPNNGTATSIQHDFTFRAGTPLRFGSLPPDQPARGSRTEPRNTVRRVLPSLAPLVERDAMDSPVTKRAMSENPAPAPRMPGAWGAELDTTLVPAALSVVRTPPSATKTGPLSKEGTGNKRKRSPNNDEEPLYPDLDKLAAKYGHPLHIEDSNDKENNDGGSPRKRVKMTTASITKIATRIPTTMGTTARKISSAKKARSVTRRPLPRLPVKTGTKDAMVAEKEVGVTSPGKTAAGLTMARLNALAMPKRRG